MRYSVWHPTPEVNSLEEVIEVILREKDNFSICDNETGEVIFSIENGKIGVCDEPLVKALIEYASNVGATTAPTEPAHKEKKAKAVKVEKIPACGFELYDYNSECLPCGEPRVETTEDIDRANYLRVWTDQGVKMCADTGKKMSARGVRWTSWINSASPANMSMTAIGICRSINSRGRRTPSNRRPFSLPRAPRLRARRGVF